MDASNGSIAFEYVGKAKINSNWAVDKHNQRVLVVGDVGKATVLDISFINATSESFHKANRMQPSRLDKNKSYISNMSAGFMDETFDSNFLDSKKSGVNSPPVKRLLRWPTVKPWFSAHSIAKLDD